MKLRPTIFLSGVSSEFASFRDAVEVEIQKKGCFAENQSSFGVDYHTVEEMLRRRIKDSDAVIHIVGFRFGAEPKDRPADKPRRSYTQMEYDIARELEKPLYVFLSSDGNAPSTEDAEATALQLAHRQTVQDGNSLYYFFKDKAELSKLAGEIDIVAHADFRVDMSRIDKYAPAELVGREDELALLNDAWLKVRRAEAKRPHILTFVALGGEGKTSLVAKWLANLAYENWPGCDSVFAWSFYSQGTREQYTASSDLFLKEAITFFGNDADKEFAASPAGAYEKGQRLARIVGQRHGLLVLDGLEPLQYAPTSPTPGELNDGGITALLKGLAARNNGLCIVTTRYSLPNLKAFWQTTAAEIPLTRLSRAAGIHLLKTLGVKGSTKEFEILVEDVKGHALTLNLLGTYLRDAHGGDIRRRDLVKLEEADTEEQSGHAFRVMEAYERVFEKEGDSGKCALSLLRLLGLFDRPVSVDCLQAMLEEPAIPGLTEPLIASKEVQRNVTFKRLEDAKLITVNRDRSSALISLDAHPLLREYFAQQLRFKHQDVWRAAHRRLYEHLCATPDIDEPTLEDLQPLYQAIAHGCQAGMEEQACHEVHYVRILREAKFYATRQLGAIASDLGAVACFFEIPWSLVSPALTEHYQASVLNLASFRLSKLGRLTEALEPMQVSMSMCVKHENWVAAAVNASNLCLLKLTLGSLGEALKNAEQAVTYADQSGDADYKILYRCEQAEVLNQAGRWHDAKKYFSHAEQMLKELNPQFPFLSLLQGFQYCELLLATFEQAAWRRTLGDDGDLSVDIQELQAVYVRAEQTLKWAKTANAALMGLGLSYLGFGRVVFYQAVLRESGSLFNFENPILKSTVDAAVHSLRRANMQDYVPRGLLSRAWLRFFTGPRTGAESAQEDLDEAWEIAERGPMRLHMSDIHLYRARLFFREKDYPWKSPEADLKEARKLIEQCGYWRRKEELEDAERVILKNPR